MNRRTGGDFVEPNIWMFQVSRKEEAAKKRPGKSHEIIWYECGAEYPGI